MKRSIIIYMSMITIIAYAAEQGSLKIDIGKTSFSIIKGNMYEHDKEVDCMVVGRREQRMLQKPDLNEWTRVGKTDDEFCWNKVYFLPKKSTITTDENNCSIGTKNALWERAETKNLKCQLIRVVEPCFTFDANKISYYRTKDYPNRPNCCTFHYFLEDDAIQEAAKDLELCYNNALKKGLEILKDRNEKKIALAALSTDFEFSQKTAVPATFKAIIEFIKNNSGYASIQLFVRSDSELDLYKQLCKEHLAQERQD